MNRLSFKYVYDHKVHFIAITLLFSIFNRGGNCYAQSLHALINGMHDIPTYIHPNISYAIISSGENAKTNPSNVLLTYDANILQSGKSDISLDKKCQTLRDINNNLSWPSSNSHHLYLRTNLVAWLMLMANISAEFDNAAVSITYRFALKKKGGAR